MSILSTIKAALKLAPVETPKAPRKALSLPSFLKSAPNPNNIIAREDRGLANTDVTTFRTDTDSRKVIRQFVKSSPDLSAAVFHYIRTGISDRYTAVCKNLDGSFNPEATATLQAVIQRLDVLGDYRDGFIGTNSLRSTAESLAFEFVCYGAGAVELVLDKTLMPKRLQPISTTQIEFKADKDGTLKPVQKTSSAEIDLDVPTFFYTSLDQDLLDVYASSPIESAIQAVLFQEAFANDVRRVISKAIHPRVNVVIDEEKLRRSIPSEYINDPEQITAYYNTIISQLEQKINGLRPEDALIYMDSIGVSLDNNGNISLATEYETIQNIANARLATGAKALPAILGHGVGSSNIASTETMLFARAAQGVVTAKLNELFSRAFTLALRLLGQDVVVEFRYAPVELRPETELEAFKQTKQQRTLELLSYGFLSDEEAALELTGRLPPAGFKPLSGTGFLKAGAVQDSANLYGGSSNDGSTLNKNLKPDTPTEGRGGNKKAEDEAPEIQAQVITPNITVNTTVESQQTTKARVLKMRRDADGTLVLEQEDEQ